MGIFKNHRKKIVDEVISTIKFYGGVGEEMYGNIRNRLTNIESDLQALINALEKSGITTNNNDILSKNRAVALIKIKKQEFLDIFPTDEDLRKWKVSDDQSIKGLIDLFDKKEGK